MTSLVQKPFKQDGLISGKLLFSARNINGTWFNVYQITADDPRLFTDRDEFCPDHSPVTFHIVVFKDKQTKTDQAFFRKESRGDRDQFLLFTGRLARRRRCCDQGAFLERISFYSAPAV